MGPAPAEDVVALVTGGYKNLGKEISKQLKDHGYRVVATYRSDQDLARKTSEELGIEVHYADMTDEGDISKLFSHLRSRNLKVCILVNNISSFPVGPILDMGPDVIDEAYRSTFRSAFLTMIEAVKDMKEEGWGRIINISMAGTVTSKGYRMVAVHGAMKSALNVLTLSLAEELREFNIDVNGVLPGIIDREDRPDEWRRSMERIAPGRQLTDDISVAVKVMELISGDQITGKLEEVL